MKRFSFNDVEFVSCDYVEATELIIDALQSDKIHVFSHLNLYNFYLLCRNKFNYNHPAIVNHFFFEGIFLKIGMFALGKGWLKDTNGTDLSEYIFKEFSKMNIKLFLLGADESTIGLTLEKMICKLKSNVVGFYHGFFSQVNESDILQIINSLGADALISGMGFKKEIVFAYNNSDKLNVRLIWNVGGLFDFLSEKKKRAPEFLRKIKMEWLYRFCLEPGKKFFRNVIPPIWFFILLVKLFLKKIRLIS
jgi:beta-1,4-glucosyltransferase